MGVLDGILDGPTEAPDIKIVPIDEGTNKRIESSADQAMRSTGDRANQMNAGIDSAGLLPSQQKFNQQEGSLGMNQGITGDAIRNKYKISLGEEMMKIKRQNTNSAELQRADDLTRVQGVLQARQDVQMGAYKRLMMAHKNKQAARANFLSSIFGLAGMVGGAAIGGAPGAMAGKGVANAAAPQQSMTTLDDTSGGGRYT